MAVLLVCAVFPLIWVGGLVTSYEAGMAVPDWPTTYGFNLFLYPWTTWILGPWDLFIEHAHRLLGALAGLLSIALAITLWRLDNRRWMHVAGIVAILGVILQGILGGMRVEMNERTLARIHGCLGPAFFAYCVALAIMTSPLWRSGRARLRHDAAGKLQRLAIVTAVLAYFQLVLGSFVRHVPYEATAGAFQVAVVFHLFMAAVLTLHIGLLSFRVVQRFRDVPALARPAYALAAMIVIQLVLGCAVWVANYGWPSWFAGYAWASQHVVQAEGTMQAHVTTAHVALGSLILAVSLLVALRSCRLLKAKPVHNPAGSVLTWEVAV